MGMQKVKNTTMQPIYLNLSNGKSVKIRARGIQSLDSGDIQCPEVQYYKKCGQIILVKNQESKDVSQKGQSSQRTQESYSGTKMSEKNLSTENEDI